MLDLCQRQFLSDPWGKDWATDKVNKRNTGEKA